MTDISDLLDRYWYLAHAEGRERRQYDTDSGDAQECRSALDEAYRTLITRLAEARAEALEEAAKLLDAEDERLKKIWDDHIASGQNGAATSSHGIPAKYAAAIRALKSGGANG